MESNIPVIPQSPAPTPVAASQFSLKRVFLVTLIVSLSISALVAIFVFLFGDFGEVEGKTLLTTLTIGIYSLIGLCCSILYERRTYILLALAGIAISAIGLLFTLVAIWEVVDIEDIWKPVLIIGILAISAGHASLLLLIRAEKNIVRTMLFATVGFVALVAAMIIYIVLSEFDSSVSEFYYRLLGVFAVLDVLGTIVTPITKKATN